MESQTCLRYYTDNTDCWTKIGVAIFGAALSLIGIVISITDSPHAFVNFAAGYVIELTKLIFAGPRYSW